MLRGGHAEGERGAGPREFNGEDDHVHLLAYPPKVSVPALVNSPKGVPPGACGQSSPGA
jgi:hypothetical protein